MSKFLDYHATLPPLPPEAVQTITGNLKAGKADQFGVVALNVFVGEGKGWCLTEAPSAEAVCQSHAAMGFQLEAGDVHQVTSLA